jgi:TatD DNase family protein
MIDSHCHLDHEPLSENLTEVIKRSKKVGIKKILTICTTLKSFKDISNLINFDEIIYGTFGIHPHEADKDIVNKNEIQKFAKQYNKIIGIGETGLDFFYNHSDKKRQIESFKAHIEAAITLNLPIIVHSRDAEKETFEILNNYRNDKPKILMHCFTGSFDLFKKLNNLDTYFSASGIITFKNSKELQETFSQIPQEKLLIETDSPFLAPIPMRGKKNEPSYIIYTLKKLSELKKLTLIEMSKITTNNFEKLFFNE